MQHGTRKIYVKNSGRVTARVFHIQKVAPDAEPMVVEDSSVSVYRCPVRLVPTTSIFQDDDNNKSHVDRAGTRHGTTSKRTVCFLNIGLILDISCTATVLFSIRPFQVPSGGHAQGRGGSDGPFSQYVVSRHVLS